MVDLGRPQSLGNLLRNWDVSLPRPPLVGSLSLGRDGTPRFLRSIPGCLWEGAVVGHFVPFDWVGEGSPAESVEIKPQAPPLFLRVNCPACICSGILHVNGRVEKDRAEPFLRC